MPELPEVETIKRQLERKIKGKKITDVEVRFSGSLKGVSSGGFKKTLKGARIKKIGRRAKLVLISLSNNNTLIIH